MPNKIAILNTDADTLEGLALALGDAGFHPVTINTRGTTRSELDAFLDSAKPDVVVFDIGPPYVEAIRHYRDLRHAGPCRTKPFVLTTTARRLELNDLDDGTEVIEKPCSFERLVRAVRRAVRRGADPVQ